MKKWWLMKAVKVVLFAVSAGIIFGCVIMGLWNALIPEIFSNAHSITFWQGIGLLVLARLLFGGFGHRWGGHRWKSGQWKYRMEQKMANMTEEEKEAFKSKLKSHCGPYWDRNFEKEETTTN